MQQVHEISLEQIQASPTNPRKRFDAGKLEELAHDIREKGIVQPLLLRPLLGALPMGDHPLFEIIFGERRFRAARLAGLASAPCMVRELTDRQALEIQMIENLQRDDLDPLEEADGYQQMLEMRGDDGQLVYDIKRLAAAVGKDYNLIRRRLWLRDLPAPAKEALLAKRIRKPGRRIHRPHPQPANAGGSGGEDHPALVRA